MHGCEGNDALDSGPGNDRMAGNGSEDTYLFHRDAGHDTIYESPAPLMGSDTVLLDDDIKAEDLFFRKEGNHLIVQILNTDDSILIDNW